MRRSGEVTLDPTNPKNAPLYGTQSGGWIKLNSGARSFYRVLYPKEQREQLQQAIADQDPGLGTEDRLELQADMWAFCFAGVVTLEEYKNFTEGYRNETEEAVGPVCVATSKPWCACSRTGLTGRKKRRTEPFLPANPT